jgi:integrase
MIRHWVLSGQRSKKFGHGLTTKFSNSKNAGRLAPNSAPRCKPHGLRKAAGRLLAEAGATVKMIMSVLGHTTLAEAERYTEQANQAGLAEDAVIKLEAHKANRIAQTTSVGLGKTPKARGKSDRKE